jgi:peptidyl-prolyl cis-trans isomerase A (cyclophilin A)
MDPKSPEMNQKAPEVFRAKFEVADSSGAPKGSFVIEAHREWAPNGVDRFYNLVRNGFFNDVRFFRVVSGFMVQFGIHGNPKVSTAWKAASLQDDPVTQKNTRGMVTYAMTSQPNSRTTQIFINFKDNLFLDKQRFAPFAQVVEGMDVVDALYAEYGEGAPRGKGPDQGRMQSEGNTYLKKDFPKMDYITRATIVE